MEKINVAVTYNMIEPHKKDFITLCEDRCNLSFYDSASDIVPFIENFEVILGEAPAEIELFKRAKKLKWLHSHSAGVDNYVDIIKNVGGIVLTNSSGAYGQGISEYMIAYVLVIMKKLQNYVCGMEKREWSCYGVVRTIEGSRVTVVGIGNLGGTFAKKMHLLGAHVRGVCHFRKEKPDYLDDLYTVENLDEALEGADIVALCLPNTPKTIGLMSRERIFAMRQGAILLNVGRGFAVDQVALVEALNAKRIYAGLDVTTPEPLPPDDPLWSCDNLFVTPHISGGLSSALAPSFISALIVRNMEAYLDGRPLENVVDLDLGY